MEFKAATEVHDFQINWVAELGTDTISTTAWVLATGITKDSDSSTSTTTTAWISGGTVGMTYKLTNTITTAGSRTHVKIFHLRIQDQRAG